MSEEKPRRIPRLFSCLIKGPLGCLAFLIGASVVAGLPSSGRDLFWIDWVTIVGSVATIALAWVAVDLLAEVRRSRAWARSSA